MKFPSIKSLAESGARTVKRFPFELLFALTASIATTVNIELDNIDREGESWCLRLTMMANLGLLLNLSATLYAEAAGLSRGKKLLLNGMATVVTVGLLFIINPAIREADYIRFFLLSITLHLVVAYAAFTSPGQIQGFWQFNKTLFLRFLTAALYCIVLGAGISAAIGAVNYLFGVDFEIDTFQILWTWIVFMFGTTFFLAGVPGNFNQFEQDTSYPKGLKIFTQYVLIPLATLYVIILLAYEGKILAEWDLPKGNVGYLIMGYSVFGILSLLLVYPIREQAENKWLKTYARSFYFLMLPLLALLFVAIGARVFKYGITEFRYFLLALACWLLFITIYFLLFKKQNIKLIPITLSILTLVSVYGPQSAFSVSAFSQRRILANIMQRNGAYINGKFIPVKKINKQDGNRAVAVLEYLVMKHDLTSLQPYFETDLQLVGDWLGKQKSKWNKGFVVDRHELRSDKLTWAKKNLNLNKFSGRYYDGETLDTDADMPYANFQNQDDLLPIDGYDFMLTLNIYDTTAIFAKPAGLTVKQSSADDGYRIWINGEQTILDIKQIIPRLDKINEKHLPNKDEYNYSPIAVPSAMLTLNGQSKSFEVKLILNTINYYHIDSTKVGQLNTTGTYFIKRK